MNKPMRARPIGLCSGLLLLCAVFFLEPPATWAADCKFVLGFATLKAMIDGAEGPEKVGQCLENEHFDPKHGDALQETTGGLLVWRKADNRTAFTDGYRTWINGPSGLQVRLNTEHFDWEAPAALTLEQLKNAEYESEWPTSGKATLTDGRYFEAYEPGSASGVTLTLSEQLALGDLNGDGMDDAVVILYASGSGSGTFRYLTAVLNERGQPRHVASVFLGDRVRIEALDILYGRIIVQMIAHGPDDGLCCPTQEVTRAFQLAGDTLEVAPSIVDVLWHWERFEDTRGPSWDITVADPQKYTLRLLPDGTFQVKADCNTGSGAYTVAGSSITLEVQILTRAACPPESRSNTFLTRLGEVVTYVLHEGKLFLNLKIDGGNMVFAKAGSVPQS